MSDPMDTPGAPGNEPGEPPVPPTEPLPPAAPAEPSPAMTAPYPIGDARTETPGPGGYGTSYDAGNDQAPPASAYRDPYAPPPSAAES